MQMGGFQSLNKASLNIPLCKYENLFLVSRTCKNNIMKIFHYNSMHFVSYSTNMGLFTNKKDNMKSEKPTF